MVQWLNVHELLYHKKLQNYKDTKKKTFLWQEQADEMGVNVEELKVHKSPDTLHQAEQEVRGWCGNSYSSYNDTDGGVRVGLCLAAATSTTVVVQHGEPGQCVGVHAATTVC